MTSPLIYLIGSLLVFSADMLILPSARRSANIELIVSLKYLAYASILVFNYGALDVIRIRDGRPADDAFIEEVVACLGLAVLVLGLSESGLIASMF